MLLFTFSTLYVIHTINHMNLEAFLNHVVYNFKNTVEGASTIKVSEDLEDLPASTGI